MISIQGPDATDFLQNLMTADIRIFEKEGPERAAIFTGFLNVKGKVLFDAIVVKPRLAGQTKESGEMEYWIDVESEEDAPALMKHLKKYALRKKLQISDMSHVIKSFQI